METSGDPFSSAGGSAGGSGEGEPQPVAPVPAGMPPAELAAAMPKLWIGYLMAAVIFVGEMVAVGRNPELLKTPGFVVPPLEIFLPAFIARVYWFVCIYRYHKILANVPRYVHPISPGKAVGFHFIPIYNLYWIFHWPTAVANFVNARFGAPLMRGWVLGLGAIAAMLCQTLLDAAFGTALLFLATGYLAGFLKRALTMPAPAAAPPQI